MTTDTAYGYTGTIEVVTLTVSGIYDITAIGAGGGSSPYVSGGAGATISADFSLAAGTELDILVGGAGAASNVADGGGGGGGSFVSDAGNAVVIRNTAAAEPLSVPLVIAGGGGGAGGGPGGMADDAGTAGNTVTAGVGGGGDLGGAGGSGGNGGSGGGISTEDDSYAGGGGGGGGYATSGGDAYSAAGSGGTGGAGFAAGGANSYAGGFGGGGQGGIETTTTADVTVAGTTTSEQVFIPGDGGGGGGYSGGGGAGTDEITQTPTGPSSDSGAGGGGGGSYIDTAAAIVVVVGGGGGGGIVHAAAAPAIGTPVFPPGATGTNGEVTIDLLCFLAGTAIATPAGEAAVESLRVGDDLLTADGRTVRLRWIGRRRVDAATRLDHDLHYPVRVRRDAVAPGVPARDLLVTGDHALFIDGRLIPARLLVNGASIRAEREMAEFTYFHLELDGHDLLLAEGLAAESYLDTGNRHLFSKEMISSATRGDGQAAYATRGVAPLALAAAEVEPVWRRLAARAGVAAPACGFAPGAGAVHLLAGGARLRPVCAAPGRLLFALPAGVSEAVIASDTIRPADQKPWLDDRRRLGVQVRRIRVHGEDEPTDVALDGPLLAAGWHGVEPAGRWTAGAATLRLPPRARSLELLVAV